MVGSTSLSCWRALQDEHGSLLVPMCSLVRALRDARHTLRSSAGAAALALAAYGCDGGITPPVNRPPEVSAAITPPQPYDDEPLRLTYTATDPDGDRLTIERKWYRNSAPVADLANQDNVPASRTEPNDNWRARVIATDGEKADTAFAEVNIRPIPTATIRIPVVNYFDLAGVPGLRAILQYNSAKADTVTTDASGIASFTYDTRMQVSSPTISIPSTTWYNFRRAQTLTAADDTVFMIDRFVDGNGVDKLDYCKYETRTDGTAGTAFLTWNKPLLNAYLARSIEPTPSLGEYAWQGADAWNRARERVRFAETQTESNADVVIVWENRPDYSVDIVTTSIGNINYIVRAIIRTPITAQPTQGFTNIMMHEFGHSQGLIREYTLPSYIMNSGGISGTIQAVESGCSLILSNFMSGFDMSQYSR